MSNHLLKKHCNSVRISHAGDRLSEKAAEKSGDLIMKKLAGKLNKPSTPSTCTPTSVRPREESTDMISGSGIKRRRKIV